MKIIVIALTFIYFSSAFGGSHNDDPNYYNDLEIICYDQTPVNKAVVLFGFDFAQKTLKLSLLDQSSQETVSPESYTNWEKSKFTILGGKESTNISGEVFNDGVKSQIKMVLNMTSSPAKLINISISEEIHNSGSFPSIRSFSQESLDKFIGKECLYVQHLN